MGRRGLWDEGMEGMVKQRYSITIPPPPVYASVVIEFILQCRKIPSQLLGPSFTHRCDNVEDNNICLVETIYNFMS